MDYIHSETISKFAGALRKKGKRPATVESYCRDVSRFSSFLIEKEIRFRQVDRDVLFSFENFLRVSLSEKENSVRRSMIGVRQFFRFLKEEISESFLSVEYVPIPERKDVVPSVFEEKDILRLIHMAERGRPDIKAARDAAIIALLSFEGVKANELVMLRWSDFLGDAKGGTLKIFGVRERAISLSEAATKALLHYRELYTNAKHPAFLKAGEKKIFIAFKGREILTPIPSLTRHGLKFLLYELGEKAGIEGLTTEKLRHYSISRFLVHGKSPEYIMKHLGLKRKGNVTKHLTILRAKTK